MPVLSTFGAASLRAFGAFRPTTQSVFFTATGGTIYTDPTSPNYKIHEFTSDGTFSITLAPPIANIEVMMVGGGGGGSYGGGGAGGYIYRSAFSVSVGSYSISIGSGGSRGVPASKGGNTTFSTLVALGGGAGGGGTFNGTGGSGGGGVDGAGPAGLQPSSASGGFGNKGGDWTSFGNDGGGGGAGSSGSVPSGGGGKLSDIVNSSGVRNVVATGGTGNIDSVSEESPTIEANTGNGGWGGGYNDSNNNYVDHGDGQSGIVRIRYQFQ